LRRAGPLYRWKTLDGGDFLNGKKTSKEPHGSEKNQNNKFEPKVVIKGIVKAREKVCARKHHQIIRANANGKIAGRRHPQNNKTPSMGWEVPREGLMGGRNKGKKRGRTGQGDQKALNNSKSHSEKRQPPESKS